MIIWILLTNTRIILLSKVMLYYLILYHPFSIKHHTVIDNHNFQKFLLQDLIALKTPQNRNLKQASYFKNNSSSCCIVLLVVVVEPHEWLAELNINPTLIEVSMYVCTSLLWEYKRHYPGSP